MLPASFRQLNLSVDPIPPKSVEQSSLRVCRTGVDETKKASEVENPDAFALRTAKMLLRYRYAVKLDI